MSYTQGVTYKLVTTVSTQLWFIYDLALTIQHAKAANGNYDPGIFST